MGLFLRKNHLLRCWGWLSLLNLIGALYIISITKTASKKIVALIRSMKFFSTEVALYLYKSTIQPCMECCCHVWTGAPSCYFELFDKLQKTDMQFCWSFTCCLSWTVGSSSKCSQFKSFQEVLLLYMFIWTGRTGSTSLFSKEVFLLFW